MTLTINIPDQFEDILRKAIGDNLDRAALEALAAEAYRQHKLSRYQIQQILGFENRWQFEKWMIPHGLYLVTALEELDPSFLVTPNQGPL